VSSVSLQDLVIHVASNLRDCVEGTVTTAGAATFRDSSKAHEKDDRFNGSEIIFREPTYNGGGTQPFTVTDFARTNAIFTLNAGGAIALGERYALVNVAGKGYPYAEIIRALELALDAVKPTTLATDEATLAYVADDYEYTVPAAFITLERVYAKRTVNSRVYRIPLTRGRGWGYDYDLIPGTRTLVIHGSPLAGDIFAVVGEQRITLPTTLDGTIDVPVEPVVNAAVEFLTRGGDQREQGISAGQYLDRLRTVPVYARANRIALP
jgi:hypothetical protein